MSPCFPRQSGLLVALAAGAWNSKVRSLRACRSCDGSCYMPSISIGEGERQGAQKNLPRQRERLLANGVAIDLGLEIFASSLHTGDLAKEGYLLFAVGQLGHAAFGQADLAHEAHVQ